MKGNKQEKKEKGEDIVYVGIDEPVAVRRNLLEASKSMVRVLKGQHNVSLIRAEKHRLIEELRAKVNEISQLVTAARQALPQMDESTLPKPAVPKAEKPKMAPQPRPAAPARKAESHMDKFEKELHDIEDKLKSL